MRHFGFGYQHSIMRVALVLGLAIAAAVAAPPPLNLEGSVSVVKSFVENDPIGNYKFYYELSDGTAREEEGELRNEGQENQYIFVKGYYSYVGPDSVLYRIEYSSGIDGYKPEIDEGPGGAIPPDVAASLIG